MLLIAEVLLYYSKWICQTMSNRIEIWFDHVALATIGVFFFRYRACDDHIRRLHRLQSWWMDTLSLNRQRSNDRDFFNISECLSEYSRGSIAVVRLNKYNLEYTSVAHGYVQCYSAINMRSVDWLYKEHCQVKILDNECINFVRFVKMFEENLLKRRNNFLSDLRIQKLFDYRENRERMIFAAFQQRLKVEKILLEFLTIIARLLVEIVKEFLQFFYIRM